MGCVRTHGRYLRNPYGAEKGFYLLLLLFLGQLSKSFVSLSALLLQPPGYVLATWQLSVMAYSRSKQPLSVTFTDEFYLHESTGRNIFYK